MNIGNLIKSKVNTSSFTNVKELYLAMKDIMGDKCCAYNTFTDSLNKNKDLSSAELLTLSVLLNIDLNTIAMHYVNTQINLKRDILYVQDYTSLERNILNILNIFASREERGSGCKFTKNDIAVVNNKVYAISIDDGGDNVLAYEVKAEKERDDYTFRVKTVASFNYFKSILHSYNISVTEFKGMNLLDKFNFVKNESSTYYEIFPDTEEPYRRIELDKFKKSIIYNEITAYIRLYSDALTIGDDGAIYDQVGEKLSDDNIVTFMNRYIDIKYNTHNFVDLDSSYIGVTFRLAASLMLDPQTANKDILIKLKTAISDNLNKKSNTKEPIEVEDINFGDVFVSKRPFGYNGIDVTYYILEKTEEPGEIDGILLIECDEKGYHDPIDYETYLDLHGEIILGDTSLSKLVERMNLVPLKYADLEF